MEFLSQETSCLPLVSALAAAQRDEAFTKQLRQIDAAELDLPSAKVCQLRRSCKWDADAPMIGAWVAEMDFATAPPVREALHRAIEENMLGYQPAGLTEGALEACRLFQGDAFGWDIDEGTVFLSPNVLSVFRALMQTSPDGTPVVVPTPAYMPFLFMPSMCNRPLVEVPSLRAQNFSAKENTQEGTERTGRWVLDLDRIDAVFQESGGKGILVLCNPWNPVGQSFTERELCDLAEVVAQYPEVVVFSDEIHSPLAWGAQHVPFAKVATELAGQIVTATAASKGWNIAGLHCAQYICADSGLQARVKAGLGGAEHATVNLGVIAARVAYSEGRKWLMRVHQQIAQNVETVRSWVSENSRENDRLAVLGPLGGQHASYRITLPESTYLSWWETPNGKLGENPAETLARHGLRVNAGKDLGKGCEAAFRLNLACSPEVLQEILAILRNAA